MGKDKVCPAAMEILRVSSLITLLLGSRKINLAAVAGISIKLDKLTLRLTVSPGLISGKGIGFFPQEMIL